MADEFWASIYNKLLQNFEFIKDIALDTPDSELLSLIKPNRELCLRCAPLFYKNKIADKNALVEQLIKYAKNNEALCKVLLFSWVENNKETMLFTAEKITSELEQRLMQGVFGDEGKIKILSQIEPRSEASELFKRYFLQKSALKEPCKAESAPIPASNELNELNAKLKDALSEQAALKSNIKELKSVLEAFKSENKMQKKLLEAKGKELKAINERVSKTFNDVNEIIKSSAEKQQVINRLTAELEGRKKTQGAAPSASEKELNELKLLLDKLSVELDTAKAELLTTQKSLQIKNSALKRIKDERAELLTQLSTLTDKGRTVEILKRRLSEAEKLYKLQKTVYGQLIARYQQEETQQWLFITFSGELYFLPSKIINSSNVVADEFCALAFDEDLKPAFIESLEDSAKKELNGYLLKEENDFVFVCESTKWPVYASLSERQTETAAKGVWLPSFGDREAGIYRIEPLKNTDAEAKTKALKRSDYKTKEASLPKNLPYCFNGQKIVIVGGDYIGRAYEKELSALNLKVRWHSGFERLNEAECNFNSADLMVIIIRQISHSLLRKLTLIASKNKLPIMFCAKRGLSGVASELNKFFTK